MLKGQITINDLIAICRNATNNVVSYLWYLKDTKTRVPKDDLWNQINSQIIKGVSEWEKKLKKRK